jgi:nucleotide-binding universal stress UspA family protein
MKTILVPTDYSDASRNALHYAMELAKLSKAKILLFHAYQIPLPTGDIPVMLISPAELEKENVDRIKKLEKELAKKYSDEIKVEHMVRAGFVSDEIVASAHEKKADLIVMGIKGESKLSRVLIGSNTVTVIHKSKTPVLAIPEGCKYKKPEKMLLAYDYRIKVSKDILGLLKNFTGLFKAKLLVLDMVKPVEVPVYENAVAGLSIESSLKDIDHSLYFPEGEDLVAEINSFVGNYKADWVVMIPHQHKFLSGLFHKSNTKQMAFHTHVPLLTFHS